MFQPPLQPARETYSAGEAVPRPWSGNGATPGPSHRTSLQDVGLPSWGAPQERPVLAAQQGSRKRRAAEMDYPEENEPLPSLAAIRPAGRTLGGDRPVEAYTGELVDMQPAYVPVTRVTVPAVEMALAVPAVKTFHNTVWDVDSDTAESLEYRNFTEATSKSACRRCASVAQSVCRAIGDRMPRCCRQSAMARLLIRPHRRVMFHADICEYSLHRSISTCVLSNWKTVSLRCPTQRDGDQADFIALCLVCYRRCSSTRHALSWTLRGSIYWP